MGKSSMNGPFSMAMLKDQRVIVFIKFYFYMLMPTNHATAYKRVYIDIHTYRFYDYMH